MVPVYKTCGNNLSVFINRKHFKNMLQNYICINIGTNESKVY